MSAQTGEIGLIHARSALRGLRKIRWKRVILVLLTVWLAVSFGLALAVHTYGYQDHAADADVIVVLGAGLHRNSQPTAAQRYRTRRAAELWQAGYAPYIICTGGQPGYATRSEADACKEILLDLGVPEAVIQLEGRSRSTLENALYSREIMRAHGWHTALVVSDRYHLLRANWLFKGVGITTFTSPATVAYLSPQQYAWYVIREVAAIQWQLLIDFLNLPFTHVSLV